MKKLMYLIVFSTLIGCSSGGKFGNLTSDNISVDPNVLEVKGGEVPVTITGTFPAKFFPKDGELEFIPVLVTSKRQVKGNKVVFYGEKVRKPGRLVVSYENGGTFSETQLFPYEDGMRMAELYGEFRVKKGDDEIKFSRVKLADGIITTPLLVDISEAAMISRDASETVSSETYGTNFSESEVGIILYVVGRSDIRDSELSKLEMKNLLSALRSPGEKSYIQITSAASPEGTEGLNSNLAKHRDREASEYVSRELKKAKLDIPIRHTMIDEDWDGLYENIAASNMKDKDQMIQHLKSEKDVDKRQAVLHKYMAGNELFEVSLLPPLRRSIITLHTDGEIITNITVKSIMVSEKDLSKMSLNDRLFTTAGMNDADGRIASYRAIIDEYPDDWRAYNNLATVYLYRGNWDDASSLIDRSIVIQEHPESRYNKGFVHLAKGNMREAKTCFSNVSSSSEWRDAKGAAEILNGNYREAVAVYGNKVCNNAALAQLLNKEYSRAASTLSKVEAPNATTYYLKAVVGARTNDRDMVYNNLREVMSRDKKLGHLAKTDIEFAKYMQDSQFTSMLQ